MPSGCRTKTLLGIALAGLACAGCGSGSGTPSAAPPPATHSATTAATQTSSSTQSSSTTTSSTSTTALPGAGHPTITVGDKNYTEQFVLGQLYVQALTAQGFSVNLNQNIGPTSVTVQAVKAGSLSIYPEYLNVFDTSVAGYRHAFRNELDAYRAAQHYTATTDLQLLDPTRFADTYGIAVTDAYAAVNHLASLGDLARVASALTIGGPPQFQTVTPGLSSLSDVYGVVPATFKAVAFGDQYGALNASTIQAAFVSSTDGQLGTGNYVLLRDPRHAFGWGNVVPVTSTKVVDAEGPAFVDTIERVDDTLTTGVIRQLNFDVDVAGENPVTVAKVYLETHGLLTPLTF